MPVVLKLSPEMRAKLHAEQDAIEAIRRFYPHTPQKTLARQIRDHSFPAIDEHLAALLKQVGYRTLLSVYSVIRRYDRCIKDAYALSGGALGD